MSTTTATTVTDTLAARAAFTTFIEPADGIAGALIEALGPVAADHGGRDGSRRDRRRFFRDPSSSP